MSHQLRILGKESVLAIHSAAIERFGGLPGVRDEGLLDSALAQPFQTFDGKEIYPSLEQKAARYAYGIVSNHPFIDGNKRVATAVMASFLRCNGCQFRPKHEELLSIMMGVADGNISYKGLVEWLQKVSG